MPQGFQIGARKVGPGEPVFIVAELSANHLHDYERAARLVRLAAECGADAVKLQTYTPDTITIDGEGERFEVGKGTPWEGRRLYDIYREAYMPWEWQPRLHALAGELGIECFSSPFDESAVEFLESFDVPAYKIASFELVDTGLIARAARTGKPLIMSTGMATRDEIATALDAARGAGAASNGIALLKCTSAYPSPVDALHLRTLQGLASEFDVPVGLSDHTLDATVVATAVALGACIVEKHFTFSRADGGPDADFSLEPEELRATVETVRLVEAALGEVRFGPTEAERDSQRYRRSLFVVADVRKGELLSDKSVRSIRPADGLAPKHLAEVLGRPAACDIARGTPLSWELVG